MKNYILMLLLCTGVQIYADEIIKNYDPANGYLVYLRYAPQGSGKYKEVKVGHANYWMGQAKSTQKGAPKPAIIYAEPGQKYSPSNVEQGTIVISPTLGSSKKNDNLILIAIYKQDAKHPSANAFKYPENRGQWDAKDYDWPLYYHYIDGGQKQRTFKIYGQQKEGFRVEW
jgi:hypothetical protein